jgi:predicted outer membrane repeat protein
MLERRAFLIVAAAVASLAAPCVASAASYTVNDPGDFPLANPAGTSCVSTDGGSCTLRAAVQAADNSGAGSSIALLAGTYQLTIPSAAANDPSTGDLDVNSKANGTTITVSGAGSGSTVIDANHIDRAFAVQIGGGLSLSGLTIEHGAPSSSSSGSQNGGAIYSDGALTLTGDITLSANSAAGFFGGGAIYADSDPGSSVSVMGATVDGNSAAAGGGIFDDSPNPMTITGSHFDHNVASTNNIFGSIGGAIEGFNGQVSVESSTFTDNSAVDGGAIDFEGRSKDSVTHSPFDGNSASGAGGAITDFDSGAVTLTGDRFHNSTASFGGAVYLEAFTGAQYAFNQDQFDANRSPGGQGGAIYIDAGAVRSSGSSFSGNTAAQGGAIFVQAIGLLALVNVTMSDNSATNGGAIDDTYPAPATLTNDTIAFNTAATGRGGGIDGTSSLMTGSGGAGVENTIIAENGGGDCDSSFSAGFDQGHNLDSDGSCFGGLGGAGDKPGVNPSLGGPADNGGPVAGAPASAVTLQTDAELTGSPAINAASNAGCPVTDERGVPRPQGPTCDMGAYEATPPIVATGAASGVSATSATLNGTVNPTNLDTSYHFEYGTSTAYGLSTASQSAGSDYAAHPESATITGLTPGITYHFRIVASNAVGTSAGSDQVFTTVGAPSARISFPANHRRFRVGQHVATSFSCIEAAGGPGIASCSDSNGAHAPAGVLGTSKPGRFTYTVTAKSKDGLSASTSISYTVLAVARVRISALHAAPLRRGCAVETGRDEREITALSADATCRHLRLLMGGTIEENGKLQRSAGGTVRVSFAVKLPYGRAGGSARVKAKGGRWRVSLVLPGVNLDPLPPRYLLTARYSGDQNTEPATAKRRIRLESERAGLSP